MINIDQINITDLFSFNQVSHQFSDGVTTVVGINRDQMGTLSNGVGKSSFMDSILYVLFGEVTKDVSLNEVVRETTLQGEASLTLSRGEEKYSIIRGRSLQPEESFLTIKEGTESFTFRRIVDGQARILSILGIPEKLKYKASDFLKTNYFSSASLELFASTAVKPAERMKIVSEALSLSKIAVAISKANKEISGVEKDQIKAQVSIDLLTPKILDSDDLLVKSEVASQLLNQIRYSLSLEVNAKELLITRQDFTATSKQLWIGHQSDLTLNQSKIDSVSESLGNWETRKSDFDSIKRDLEQKKSKLEEYQIETLRSDKNKNSTRKKKLEVEARSLDLEKSDLQRQHKEITNSFFGAIKCPKCQTNLRIKHGEVSLFDGSQLTSDREKLKSSILTMLDKVKKHNEEVRLLDESQTKITESISDYNSLNGSVDYIQTQVDSTDFDTEFEVLSESLNKLVADRVEFKSDFDRKLDIEFRDFSKLEQFDIVILEVKGNLKQIQTKIDILTLKEADANLEVMRTKDRIVQNDNLKSELEAHMRIRKITNLQLSELIKIVELFNEFRRELIRQFIPVFEASSNQYLKEMGFDYLIKLELERLKSDGEFKPELIVLVSDGIAWRSFNSYSQGEKTRIALACQFALMDIAGTRTVNFIFLDEVLDSLDKVGFQSFLKVCKKLGSRVIVTSRLSADEVMSASNSLIQIVKENGVSYLVQ